MLDMIGKVADGQRDSDCRFDLFSVDFWVDYRGDLQQCDPSRFPNGLAPIKRGAEQVRTSISACGSTVRFAAGPSAGIR